MQGRVKVPWPGKNVKHSGERPHRHGRSIYDCHPYAHNAVR